MPLFSSPPFLFRHRASLRAVVLCSVALLIGCSAPSKKILPQEKFGSDATYSRLFDAPPAHTCEAARRALLSQGYMVDTTTPTLVEGKKNFQPDADFHLQMMIRVVCVPDSGNGKVTLGFVSALQDRYTLKKANSSASLGVGAIGSVSLPFMAGSEAMIKVGSETIANDAFYESFFDLVRRYLVVDETVD